jgi:hypothetical protein
MGIKKQKESDERHSKDIGKVRSVANNKQTSAKKNNNKKGVQEIETRTKKHYRDTTMRGRGIHKGTNQTTHKTTSKGRTGKSTNERDMQPRQYKAKATKAANNNKAVGGRGGGGYSQKGGNSGTVQKKDVDNDQSQHTPQYRANENAGYYKGVDQDDYGPGDFYQNDSNDSNDSEPVVPKQRNTKNQTTNNNNAKNRDTPSSSNAFDDIPFNENNSYPSLQNNDSIDKTEGIYTKKKNNNSTKKSAINYNGLSCKQAMGINQSMLPICWFNAVMSTLVFSDKANLLFVRKLAGYINTDEDRLNRIHTYATEVIPQKHASCPRMSSHLWEHHLYSMIYLIVCHFHQFSKKIEGIPKIRELTSPIRSNQAMTKFSYKTVMDGSDFRSGHPYFAFCNIFKKLEASIEEVNALDLQLAIGSLYVKHIDDVYLGTNNNTGSNVSQSSDSMLRTNDNISSNHSRRSDSAPISIDMSPSDTVLVVPFLRTGNFLPFPLPRSFHDTHGNEYILDHGTVSTEFVDENGVENIHSVAACFCNDIPVLYEPNQYRIYPIDWTDWDIFEKKKKEELYGKIRDMLATAFGENIQMSAVAFTYVVYFNKFAFLTRNMHEPHQVREKIKLICKKSRQATKIAATQGSPETNSMTTASSRNGPTNDNDA